MKQQHKPTTAERDFLAALKTVTNHVQNGDPIEAESALEFVERFPMSSELRHTIKKGRDEINSGTLEAALTLLWMAEYDVKKTPGQVLHLFRSNRRLDGLTSASNGQRADRIESQVAREYEHNVSGSFDAAISDIVSDIYHLAHKRGMHPDEVRELIERGERNYQDEA